MRSIQTCVVITLLSAIGCALPSPVRSQYLFLDANNDGANSAADSLGAAGVYRVAVWLDTNHDHAGRAVVCPTGSPLTLSSYEFILRSSGGSVTWDSFQNSRPELTTAFGQRAAGSDFYCGFGGGEALDPGKYQLGTLILTIRSGRPALTIVPSTPLGASLGTTFGSSCGGDADDYTMQLGVDWFDTGSLGPGSGTGDTSPQTVSVDGPGHFFLGGNEIPGPWTLTRVRGVVTANDYTIPPPPAGVSADTGEKVARNEFIRRAGTLADSLNRSGVAPDRAADELETFCRANDLGASIERGDREVKLRFPNGLRLSFALGLQALHVPSRDPISGASTDNDRLAQVAEFLRTGCVVFIMDRVTSVVVPSVRKEEALRVVGKLRTGAALSEEEGRLLPRALQDQVKTPIILLHDVQEVR